MANNGKPIESQFDNIDSVKLAKENTVQSRNREGFVFGGEIQRNPLLPPYGTKERDRALLSLARDDMNVMAKGVIAGIIKRVQSTPMNVTAPEEYGDYWLQMLLNADLGNGWETFLSKLILDYSRYDAGAFVELIGSGNPSEPLVTAPVAIANLDSLRCWLTGDEEYPVWYYSSDGHVYKMHHTRIRQFVDTPESDENHRGYGYCAYSRAVSAITRDILMNRYVTQLLDDNPPPGFVLFGNMTDAKLQSYIEQRDLERQTLSGGVWGRAIKIFGMNQEQKPTVEFVSYSQPPMGFDYPTYQNQLAKEMANALNIDLTEFWELTGGNIGSSTQAQIMAQKSRGKTIGNLYKLIERFVNSILPTHCEFAFEYEDAQEATDKAQNASTWAGIIAGLTGLLSVDEQRNLLASQIPAIADVVTDEDGVIRSLDESGNADDEMMTTPDTYASPIGMEDVAQLNDTQKDISTTIANFYNRFKAIAESFIGNRITPFLAKQALRLTLIDEGRKAYVDGLRNADGDEQLSNGDELKLTEWANTQADFVEKFIDEIQEGKVTTANLDNHIKMWANKSLKDAYHKGMLQAGRNKFFIWVYGFTEHCETCLRANGQVHRLRAWAKAGVLPQVDRLQCGGYNCQCRLLPIRGFRLFGTGNLQAVARTLKEHNHNH